MPDSEKRSELVVGIFLFVGLVLLGGLILQFGRFERFLANQYKLTVVFDDASGLIKGSDVRMGGARIGRVAKLPELTENVQVEVELSIDEDIRIPIGSSFQIESATLLGDKLIVITPPEKLLGAYIEPDTRLQGQGQTGLGALQSKAQMVGDDVVRILQKAEGTLGKVDAAVEEIHASSRQLTAVLSKVNQSVLDADNLARLDSTMANLSDVTARWKDASDKLDPTLTEAREAIASLKSAADKADATIAGIKPAFEDVPDAVANISATAEKAGRAFDRVEQGEGLLGAVATDDEVSMDAKEFVRNLRRYGILRYRDDESADEDDPRDRFRGSHMGIVFQRLHLLPSLTVTANILLAQYLARQPQQSRQVQVLLEALGLGHRLHAYPGDLSLGEAQRVAIARAVANRPRLLLADEPTSSLDDANAATVINLLRNQADAIGATLLVVTHDARIQGHFEQRLVLEAAA